MEFETRSALDVVDYLERNDSKLIINISTDAVGHVLAEFDNFARMRLTGEISSDGNHIYMGPDEEKVATIAEMYGDLLCKNYFLSSFAPELVRSIALFRPDLTVDVGMSTYKVSPIEGVAYQVQTIDDKYMVYRSSLEALADDTLVYFRRRLETFDTLPLARNFTMPSELEKFINARGRPMALIQVKDFSSSGGAEATDPSSYKPAMQYLHDLGYVLVQVGREQHPDIFSQFEVVDYANSSLASFKNDLILASKANLCLVGPSGVSYFADIMGKPLVYVNNWWIELPPFSPYCVTVPALVKSHSDGKLLTFLEQMALFYRCGVRFPEEEYEPVHPNGKDILAGVQEAVELEKNLTLINKNQQRFKMLKPEGCNAVSLSRMSAAFLNRYQSIL